MLNNPLIWYCFFAIFHYGPEYIPAVTRFEDKQREEKKRSGSEDDVHASTFVSLVILISNLGKALSAFWLIVTTVAWISGNQLLPTTPEIDYYAYHPITLLLAAVALRMHIKNSTVESVCYLLSKHLDDEKIEQIEKEVHEKFCKSERAISADHIAGFYQYTSFHDQRDEAEKTMPIVYAIKKFK